MIPTLAPGDWLLVSYSAPCKSGDVVLVAHNDRVDVKRVADVTADGFWVIGDNDAVSVDSRTYGAISPDCVVAKVMIRVWPKPGRLTAHN